MCAASSCKLLLSSLLRTLYLLAWHYTDRHRTFLINNMVLTALANQLSCKHLLLQREAAGAIRNFSIDRMPDSLSSVLRHVGNLHEEFSRTNVLLPLCKAISHSNIDHLVAERLLSCFTCISTNSTFFMMFLSHSIRGNAVSYVHKRRDKAAHSLRWDPSHRWVWDYVSLCPFYARKFIYRRYLILLNCFLFGLDKSGILNKFFTPTIANQLSRSDLPNVKEAADAILDNIEDNTSHSGHKKKFSLSETENYEEFPEKEATPQGEAQDLLRKLNLEESVRSVYTFAKPFWLR